MTLGNQLYVLTFAGGMFIGSLLPSCAKPAPATVAKREDQLCELRGAERVAFAAAGGALDPVQGSLRARIETAEDAFCAARAVAAAGQ